MSGIAEKIRYLMASEGLKQKSLAEAISASPQTVNNWLKRDAISREAAQQICEKYGYSLDWLLNGIGQPKIVQAGKISTINPVQEGVGVEVWDEDTPMGEVEVPLLRDIELAAGDGSYNEEDYNSFKLRFSKATLRRVGANTDGSGAIGFPATGNSMEPVIPDGATVAVNTDDKKIVDGKIYVINERGWKRIKILYRVGPERVSIRSFNSDEHKDEEKNLTEIEIIGRVFWWSVLDY